MKNKRIIYIILIFICILMGLTIRKYNIFPELISKYFPDILWATMIYFIYKFLFPNKNISIIGIISLITTYLVEISQLYHSNWIDNIRRTTIGGLLLGYGFLFSDIICYTIGILIGVIIDISIEFIKK